MKLKKKHQICIVLVLIVLSVAVFAFARFMDSNGEETVKKDEIKPVPVILSPVTMQIFERKIKVQGNIESKNFANVGARIAGSIESLFVDEGDEVVAGETKLFQIDKLKLHQSVEIRKQELVVAGCALREKMANIESVEVELEKSEKDVKRYENLYKKKTVPIDALEQVQTKCKKMRAMKKLAHSLYDLQLEQNKQAELSLSMAEKDLSDSLVYAPISGKVSKKFRENGEMMEVGKAVLRIDDTEILEASAFLPSGFYSQVIIGKTLMSIMVSGEKVGEFKVYIKSPVIDSRLRTFEVKCLLKNPPDGVVPGALAEVEVLLEKKKGLGIPEEAIVLRAGRDVVFTVRNNIAYMIDIQKGLDQDGSVEIISDKLKEGDMIVSMGQFMLDEGKPVNVKKGGN
jgi:RND family efflux transporter MFP subunit